MIETVPYAGDGARWDALVAEHPAASYTQLAGWHSVIADSLGHQPLFRVASDAEGRWVGLLPMVRVRTPLLGHYLMSMPFLNSGGPLGRADATLALSTWAAQEAARSRVDLLELRNRTDVSPDLRHSSRKITVRLPLPATPAALFESFPSKLRSQIRRSQREGFEVRFGASERDAFYDVFAHAMRTLGTPVLPSKFFSAIASAFPEIVEFIVVYKGTEPVAAGCGFKWRGEFELHWAGMRREWQRAAPNMLLYWSCMERAIARGAHTFDFGRCTPGSGTHAFKRQWGGVDVALPWAQWSASETTAPPTKESPLFRAAAACWRRLPLVVANHLGPPIARCLP
jgi:serine/alanine adding enzyme